ncbi:MULTISPECIES: AAA family ATPase [unclassified Saccharibacter]|uniref:AAA family ATPase n=1 Tax=unclassified Saccharibacter TaxID=2648722 RepID=UPI001323A5C7|nr:MULTISPECIES: AAA family ATPase [unclassified Saccharibacter]MXV35704.1 AAA family ATPase [Saccharibacter sp. EH611]MXV58318.1 AAA family ATPase [Saccharibacter sp. EH70]MXV65794.1 AAA family ATPase [Saccharibacter sp. EH60]
MVDESKDKAVDHKELSEVASYLENSHQKIQLIYAFNGTGKTRLSREFIENFSLEEDDKQSKRDSVDGYRIIYYNSFTEDLFYWDNDVENAPKLKIHPNKFTDWILKDQGKEGDIINIFQEYTNSKIMPKFHDDYREVTFSFESGDNQSSDTMKISKGEESNFIWSIFYSLIEGIIENLNIIDPDDRDTSDFNQLKYIFIDDPVSSLDENHLIQLAVDLSSLIKKSIYIKKDDLRFIVTTHNTLFYNVMYNELKGKGKSFFLERDGDGHFSLMKKDGDSNKIFSYHLYIKSTLEEAVRCECIEKYHVMLLRNLYEKTANFLGYKNWSELLPKDGRKGYVSRVMNYYSHSSVVGETTSSLSEPEKKMVQYLLKHLDKQTYYQKGEEK